jgi:hypothetical protein
MLVDHVFTETRPLIDVQQSGSSTDDSTCPTSHRGICGTSSFGYALSASDCTARRALCISGARERDRQRQGVEYWSEFTHCFLLVSFGLQTNARLGSASRTL